MTTPQPPQGGNPYAQQPQPQGGNPFAQQPGGIPGQAPQPAPYPNQPGGFPPPVPQQPRRSKPKLIRFGGIAVAALVAIGIGIYNAASSNSDIKVGSCVARKGSNDIEQLNCSDAKAQYKVVGKLTGTTDIQQCAAKFPTAVMGYMEQIDSSKFVLCLGDNKK